jgi:gluconolactonase
MVEPSIQWVREGGKAKILTTHVEGIKLTGPNDMAFAPDGSLVFTDPGTYNPASPDPSYIHRILPDGSAKVVVAFPEPVYPNGVLVEPDGSIVWGESYTGHVARLRPNGVTEDLGRLPGAQPVPDGMKLGRDGKIYVADFKQGGIHVLMPNGKHEGFIKCGVATTNCAFDGESLWITDIGLNSLGAEPTSKGCLWKLQIPGGGAPLYKGRIKLGG